ncbi:MAG: STAS domain-containing protein [Armatimonadetes bacterium]|nr:STAS domain-containing protein [Armatimonadota bacterium]
MRDGAFALERSGEEAVVRVRCELDLHTGPTLERLAIGILGERPTAVSVDLSECPLLDSSGVRVLFRIRRLSREAGVSFRLSRCSDAAERVLRMMHLDGIFGLPDPGAGPDGYRPNPRYHLFPLTTMVGVWDGLAQRTAESRGFSAEGMVVEVPGPLRMFQVLRLDLTTPDTGDRYRFMGRVVNCRPGPTSIAEVEFLSLDPAMRHWLQERTPVAGH